jgi:hypothetical protein
LKTQSVQAIGYIIINVPRKFHKRLLKSLETLENTRLETGFMVK